MILAGNYVLLDRLYNERKRLEQEKSDLWQDYTAIKNHLLAIQRAVIVGNDSALNSYIIQIDGLLKDKP